jgi:hypothetical protein
VQALPKINLTTKAKNLTPFKDQITTLLLVKIYFPLLFSILSNFLLLSAFIQMVIQNFINQKI